METFKTVNIANILTIEERLLFVDWLEEEYDGNCFPKVMLDYILGYLANENIEKIVKKIKNIADEHDIDYFLIY